MTEAGHTHSLRLHATCVAIGHEGVLLLGRSGSGKSDLALRIISQPMKFCMGEQRPVSSEAAGYFEPTVGTLVADDQVVVWLRDGRLMARAPQPLADKIEVRGIGIVGVRSISEVALGLAVELDDVGTIERMPHESIVTNILGYHLPVVRLNPFEASSPAKVAIALAQARQQRLTAKPSVTVHERS